MIAWFKRKLAFLRPAESKVEPVRSIRPPTYREIMAAKARRAKKRHMRRK
jgi:hypothetical protein